MPETKEATKAPVIELPNGTAIEISGTSEIIHYYPDGKGGRKLRSCHITPHDLVTMLVYLNNLQAKDGPGGFVYRPVWESN